MINVTTVEGNLNTWLDGFFRLYDLYDILKQPMEKSDKLKCRDTIAMIMDRIISSHHKCVPVNFERFAAIVTKLYIIGNEIDEYMTDLDIIMIAVENDNHISLMIVNGSIDRYENAKYAQITLDGRHGKLIVKIVENGKHRCVHLDKDEVYFMVYDPFSEVSEYFIESKLSVKMVCETTNTNDKKSLS